MMQIQWLAVGRVIHLHFSEVVTLDEHEASVQACERMVAEGQPPVHIITTFSNVTSYPTLAAMRTRTPVNTAGVYGYVVLVSDNRMLNFLGSMLSQFNKTKVHTVISMEQAIAYLRSHDAALDAQMKTLLS
jgi:hypothetical protein